MTSNTAAVVTSALLVALAVTLLGPATPAAAAPFGVHLTFGRSPSSMTLSWLDTTPRAPGAPVRYGLGPGRLDGKAEVAPALLAGNRTWAFHASLGGLAPGREYYYRVPGWAASAPPRAFRAQASAEEVAARPDGFTVAVIGDMGIQGSEATRARLLQRRDEYDFVAHVGDFAYADDSGRGRDYESTWDEFFRQIEGLAGTKPYTTLLGNHDVACHWYGRQFCPLTFENATVYRARFSPPRPAGQPDATWYSFDHGNAHFVYVDTETSYPGAPEGLGTNFSAGPFGDQLAWLESDLARANLPENRAARPWVVVGGHRPLYSSEARSYPANMFDVLRRTFEPMFLRHGVDVVLAGHVHAFEALYPAAHGRVVARSFDRPAAPVTVVNGAAGNIEGHMTGNWAPPGQVPYLAYRNTDQFGYGLMTVHNASALTYDFRVAETDELAYSFTVTK